MSVSLSCYASLVFDCDGVLLDSNKVKTAAFFNAALPYGEQAANTLVEFHKRNGGISRYVKFQRFLDEMVPAGSDGPSLQELLAAYAEHVEAGLSSCEIAEGLDQLRNLTPRQRWFIVSGGAQEELRKIFATRRLAEWFDGGIFGSPDNKDEILKREVSSGWLRTPALFIGDSRYDHQAAERAGLDFIFVSDWSEFKEWPVYCRERSIPVLSAVSELISIDEDKI